MVKIILDNMLTIEGNIPNSLLQVIMKELTFKNPKFTQYIIRTKRRPPPYINEWIRAFSMKE